MFVGPFEVVHFLEVKMLYSILQLEASLAHLCFNSDDKKACREYKQLFWDLQYLRKYGLIPVPQSLPIPDPFEDPIPTPATVTWAGTQLVIHEQLVAGMVSVISGDHSPQPNIVADLFDPELRLESAKSFRERLKSGLKEIDSEIARLEKQCI